MDKKNDYKLLDGYYRSMFNLVDVFHFNSNNTKEEYEKNLGHLNGVTLTISHSAIDDNRVEKTFSKNGLKIGFIGNDDVYKGAPILKEIAKNLDADLYFWGGKLCEEGRIHYMGKFVHNQLFQVFESFDVLVVPSICKETFSLVTLEALSFGVPVIVSNMVGAKDIVALYDSKFVYNTREELTKLLVSFVKDKKPLIRFNKNIIDMPWNHSMEYHTKQMTELLYQYFGKKK